jgi:hypothetical protein
VVLGGWAVILAALILGSAPSGAVALAETGTMPAAGATDGTGSVSASVAILAPAGGATYRAGVPVALLGGAGAAGHELTGEALHWVVLRHTGTVVDQAAEATGTEASFVPAPGSSSTTTYEVRLTATDEGGSATASVTLHMQGTAPGDPPLQEVRPSLTATSPAFGISGPVRFAGPVLSIGSAAAPGDEGVVGTVKGLPSGARIELALRRGSRAAGCRWWSVRRTRFLRGACAAPRFITAFVQRSGLGRATWQVDLGAPLPAGRTSMTLRIRDRRGAIVPFSAR